MANPKLFGLFLTISIDYTLKTCQTTIHSWNKFPNQILVVGRFGSADRESSAWLEHGRDSAGGPNRIPTDLSGLKLEV
jgi:hypothetical protein